MAFSNKTIVEMARAMTSDICDDIFKSDEFTEFMQENIPELIRSRFNNQISEDVLIELSMAVFDNINLTPFKTDDQF